MFLKTLQYAAVFFGLVSTLIGILILTVLFAQWLFPRPMFDPWGVLLLIILWLVLPICLLVGHLYADHTKPQWNRPKPKPTRDDSDRGV